MNLQLTLRTNEYDGTFTYVDNERVDAPRLRWADMLAILQDVCGRPVVYHHIDFLTRFEFANGIVAVFCTQGRRKGEIVVSTDARNPQVVTLEQIEQLVAARRAELRAAAEALGIRDPSWLDDGDDDGEVWD